MATLQRLDSDLDFPHRGVQSLQLLKDHVVPLEALLLGLVVYNTLVTTIVEILLNF